MRVSCLIQGERWRNARLRIRGDRLDHPAAARPHSIPESTLPSLCVGDAGSAVLIHPDRGHVSGAHGLFVPCCSRPVGIQEVAGVIVADMGATVGIQSHGAVIAGVGPGVHPLSAPGRACPSGVPKPFKNSPIGNVGTPAAVHIQSGATGDHVAWPPGVHKLMVPVRSRPGCVP